MFIGKSANLGKHLFAHWEKALKSRIYPSQTGLNSTYRTMCQVANERVQAQQKLHSDLAVAYAVVAYITGTGVLAYWATSGLISLVNWKLDVPKSPNQSAQTGELWNQTKQQIADLKQDFENTQREQRKEIQTLQRDFKRLDSKFGNAQT